jgi:hypothetical protein
VEAQSDFRFLIPFQPGQRVALFDADDVLAHCLREERLEVQKMRMLEIDHHGDSSFDHVIIPALTAESLNGFPQEFARLLRPGGTMFAGFRNKMALERLLFWRKKKDESVAAFASLKKLRRIFRRVDLSLLHLYGIRDLSRPQHLVSLDQPAPARFFFQQMFYPHSWTAATAQKAATTLASAGLHKTLFRYFGVVAMRTQKSE